MLFSKAHISKIGEALQLAVYQNLVLLRWHERSDHFIHPGFKCGYSQRLF